MKKVVFNLQPCTEKDSMMSLQDLGFYLVEILKCCSTAKCSVEAIPYNGNLIVNLHVLTETCEFICRLSKNYVDFDDNDQIVVGSSIPYIISDILEGR